MRYSGIRVIGIRRGGGRSGKLWLRWVSPTLQSKLEYSGMKLEYLSLYHYVCELLEIIIFTSEFTFIIQQQMRKCVIHVYVLINIGGGGRSIRKLWPLGIPDIIQSKLEYAGMKLEYLSYITMYVNI